MNMPKGMEKLLERQNIPVYIEGEKEPRCVYHIPEIPVAMELMKEMAEVIERGAELEEPWVLDALKVLKKYREWE